MKRRFFAGFAAGALAASMLAAVPASALTTYDGIITDDTAKNSALTATETYTNDTGDQTTISSYNAAELKKVLVIEDDANIPAVSFNYTVSAGGAVAPTTTTHEVLAGKAPEKIRWVEEKTTSIENANDTFDTDNVGTHSAGTAGAAYTLTFAAQDVHDDNGGKIVAASDTYAVEAGSDNVLLNNTASVSEPDSYYAIKTLRLDFTDCGFTEPGIYRYIITEAATAQNGVTYDTNLTRTVDVYVEDATYTPYTENATEPGTYVAEITQYKLRIAGYVMYTGTVTAAPSLEIGTAGSASTLEDGLANTAAGDNGTTYGTPNGYEVAGAQKSEGFKNTYTTHDLTFSKTVTGNKGSKDKFFKFKVEINNATAGNVFDVDINDAASTLPAPASLNSATQSSYASQKNAPKLVAAAGKSFDDDGYTAVKNTDNTYTITAYYYLQDGDSIKIKGLADGTDYSITEYQEDYTATLALNGDNKSGADGDVISELTTEKAGASSTWTAGYSDTVLKEDTTAAFTNDRSGTIPTGVMLSTAAPAAVGVGALALVIALNVKKKREKAEN